MIEDKELAKEVDEIDVIIGGHSHDTISHIERVNNTYIVQASCYTKELGDLKLTYDTTAKKLNKVKWNPISSDRLTGFDTKTQKIIDEESQILPADILKKIGDSNRLISGNDLRIMLGRFLATQTGSHFGYFNEGGVRDNIYRGKVTKRDIWIIEPFDNKVTIIEIYGRDISGQLKKDMENENYRVYPDKKYKIATNCFVAFNKKDHIGQNMISTNKTGDFVKDVIIKYIEKNGLN